MRRFLPLIFLIGPTLAGCTGISGSMQTAASARSGPAVSTLPVEYALASLGPLGPRNQRLKQKANSDRLEQQLLLANATRLPGENMLTIEIGPAGDPRFRAAPDRDELAAAWRIFLPGTKMQMGDLAHTNRYGGFGYATGTGADSRCIYAWQIIRDLAPGSNWRTPYAARVTLRYCAPAARAGDLAALMTGLRLKPVDRDTLAALQAVNVGIGYGGSHIPPEPAYPPENPAAAATPPSMPTATMDTPVGTPAHGPATHFDDTQKAAAVPMPN